MRPYAKLIDRIYHPLLRQVCTVILLYTRSLRQDESCGYRR